MRNLIGLMIFTFALTGCPSSGSSTDPVPPVETVPVDAPAVVPSTVETSATSPTDQTSTTETTSATTSTATSATTNASGTHSNQH